MDLVLLSLQFFFQFLSLVTKVDKKVLVVVVTRGGEEREKGGMVKRERGCERDREGVE